jgi:hypothetical protein
MWVTHGSMNGRKLSGDPRVLDLTTMTWTTRVATEAAADAEGADTEEEEEEGGRAPAAAISGAAAAVAHNGAAYVFGGAERSAAASGAWVKATEATTLFPVISVRCLDLAVDPGPKEEEEEEEGGKEEEAAAMEWMDASAAVPDEPYEGEDGDTEAEAGPCPRMHHTATVGSCTS